MAAPSCMHNQMKSLAHLIFGLAGGENVTFLQDYDVITIGIPHDFILISSRNMRSDTLIWSNDTCFVQNFN